MKEISLTFYTNSPTPYQLDFFEALGKMFELKVVFFSAKENDRQWVLPANNLAWETRVLTDNFIARIFNKKIPSFHFSNAIVSCGIQDQTDFVILNGTYWSPNILILLLIYAVKRKRVYYYGEPLFPTAKKIIFQAKRISLLPVKWFTSGLLAIGANAVRSYRQYGYKKPVFNIPYNINTDLFKRVNLDNRIIADLRDKYAPAGEIVFLTSSALIPRKGVDVLIHSFIKSYKANLKLLILGDGPERRSLEVLAGDHPGIHFLGFAEKQWVPYYFAISDVFAFASWYDGWALVINEAIAAGLAIISSAEVGAASDKLIHNVNALICTPGNTGEFSKAITKMANDTEFRHRMAAESAKLKDELSSSFNAKKIYDIYTMD